MSERTDSGWYVTIKPFMDMVRKSRTLTPQQKSTLCGQAIHGDLKGARAGYAKLANVRAKAQTESEEAEA